MKDITATEENDIAREISKLVKLRGLLRSAPKEEADRTKYQAAFAAYDKALRETVLYMEKVKLGQATVNPGKERELSTLWSEASIAISEFDPKLANRCFIKGCPVGMDIHH